MAVTSKTPGVIRGLGGKSTIHVAEVSSPAIPAIANQRRLDKSSASAMVTAAKSETASVGVGTRTSAMR